MHLEEINLERLDKVNSKRKHSQITQSSAWANTQLKEGKSVELMSFVNEGRTRAAWLMIKQNIGLGLNYYYSPRIDFSYLDLDEVKYIAKELQIIAQKQNVIFWRFDPMEYFAIDDTRPVPTVSMQPEQSLYLDLNKGEEELLQGMHQKTRYNIRLALKKGVKVRRATEEDFAAWWRLMEATVTRDKFRLHHKEHYQTLIRTNPDCINLWVAEYEERIICGNIMSWYGDLVTYLHGASSNEDRNVMAPFALQWALILEAKQKGFKYYDFNGIDENKWPGVTRFKKGFGGRVVNFPGTFDLVFSDYWYKAYKIFRSLRRGLAKKG